MGQNPNYKVAAHTRTNDGTSSDLSQLLGTSPGWLQGIQAFNTSSATLAHLFVYDTTAAVTTASAPCWQGIVPFGGQLSSGSLAVNPAGAGVVNNLVSGITLSNGLAYAVSGSFASSALSTIASGLVKVNVQFQTSSCK